MEPLWSPAVAPDGNRWQMGASPERVGFRNSVRVGKQRPIDIGSFGLPYSGGCVVWSFVYLAVCRLIQLVVLLCRSDRSKELEILLLRHELAILRR